MNFNKHSNLEGCHAFLGASKYHWLNDNNNQILKRLCSQYSSSIGTCLHEFARQRIKHGIKLKKNEKNSAITYLLENGIPRVVIDSIDFDTMFKNLIVYVNDCIGFHMTPEVVLYYSDICFGTADAIQYREKEHLLRICDLKTGSTPAHMEQLIIYTALFCLEYKIKPYEINIELRIYQSNDVIIFNPTAEDIVPVMDKIITINNYIQNSLQIEE